MRHEKKLTVGQRWRAVLYSPGDIGIALERPKYFAIKLVHRAVIYVKDAPEHFHYMHYLGVKTGEYNYDESYLQEPFTEAWWFDIFGIAKVPYTTMFFKLKSLVKEKQP